MRNLSRILIYTLFLILAYLVILEILPWLESLRTLGVILATVFPILLIPYLALVNKISEKILK